MNSARLRARQKERIARRKALGESHPAEELPGIEPLLQSSAKMTDLGIAAKHAAGEGPSINLEDNKSVILPEARKSSPDSIPRMGRLSKHRFLPNHNYMGLNTPNPMPTNNFLPVLGLCAPNSNQLEPSESNLSSKLNWRQNRRGARQEFPFSLAPSSGTTSMETEVRRKETAANAKLPDALAHILQESFKNGTPDNSVPFVPVSSLNVCLC